MGPAHGPESKRTVEKGLLNLGGEQSTGACAPWEVASCQSCPQAATGFGIPVFRPQRPGRFGWASAWASRSSAPSIPGVKFRLPLRLWGPQGARGPAPKPARALGGWG